MSKIKSQRPSADSNPGPRKFRLKIIGLGGAGGNAITHIIATQADDPAFLAGADLVAINTDLQNLQAVPVDHKLQLGASMTHGLGAGGDVEIGARAAQADAEQLEALVETADIVFITAGLGGGTGGGAAPIVARLAREQGALVLAFVTLPFGFEGDRRRQVALASLELLKAQADAVICVPNDRLLKLAGETATAIEAFRKSDALVASAAQAIWQLMSRRGLINLDFADLRALVAAKHCEGLFACGAGSGPDRVKDAVAALLAHPLLDDDRALSRTEGLLISILGGPDLSLNDVQKAVEPITRVAQRAQIIMGAAIDENYSEKISITVIAATNLVPRKAVETRPAQAVENKTRPTPGPADETPAGNGSIKKNGAVAKQEVLPLDNISRGRFDKSEPTIYDGEDLDVPTFLRQGVSLTR